MLHGPVVATGELLLEVRAVGICGTDAHEYSHGPTMFPIEQRHPETGHVGPMIPGHELSGVVVEVGEGVDGFAIGDLVVSGAGISCGLCHWCQQGMTNLCESYATVGLQRNGGLAEFCSVPASTCVNAGSYGLEADTAALGQPMAITVHSMRRGRLQKGDVVVIILLRLLQASHNKGLTVAKAAAVIGATTQPIPRNNTHLPAFQLASPGRVAITRGFDAQAIPDPGYRPAPGISLLFAAF